MVQPEPPSIPGLASFEFVGEGGFAYVFSAIDLQLRRKVAVKVLKGVPNTSSRRRFDKECRAMAKVAEHDNVLDLYHAGYTEDGRPFMITRFVDGGNLAQYLPEGMPAGQAVRIVADISDGLQSAHDNGVIHRDIKPDNILISDGRGLLADFGIAHTVDDTLSVQIKGTWLYSPPETFQNLRDERSDIYSLAATLYSLIVGHPPFSEGEPQSVQALVAKIASEEVPEITADRSIPGLNKIIAKAMAKAPGDRFQSALELGEALRTVLQSQEDGKADGKNKSKGASLDAVDGRLLFAGWLSTTTVLLAWYTKHNSPFNLPEDTTIWGWLFVLAFMIVFASMGGLYYWAFMLFSAVRDPKSSLPIAFGFYLLIAVAVRNGLDFERTVIIPFFGSTALTGILNYYRFGFSDFDIK